MASRTGRRKRAVFRSAKELACMALMTALLIAAQLALSMIAGVEIVTVLFLSYCVSFGIRRGMTVATAFSLLRCLLFGFAPNVVILYLVYYNFFAAVFGGAGKFFAESGEKKRLAAMTVLAVILSAAFTLIDDAITPLFFGYSPRAALGYFYASLPVMAVQMLCSAVTVALLFVPLSKAFSAVCGGLNRQ